MERFTIRFKKVEEEDVSLMLAFTVPEDDPQAENGFNNDQAITLRWVMNHDLIPGMLTVAGNLEKMIEVEMHNFYAENTGNICSMYLQTENWEAIEKMQVTIENFIRHVIYKVGLKAG